MIHLRPVGELYLPSEHGALVALYAESGPVEKGSCSGFLTSTDPRKREISQFRCDSLLGSNIEVVREGIIGEDPRVFQFNGRWYGVDNTHGRVSLFEADDPDGKRARVPFDGKDFTFIPCIEDGYLYVMTWFDPLIIYKTRDPFGGEWETVTCTPSHWDLNMTGLPCEHKGGTPGLPLHSVYPENSSAQGWYYGFGHRAWNEQLRVQRDALGPVTVPGELQHRPFFWMMFLGNNALSIRIQELNHLEASPFNKNIIDPVSVIELNGSHHLVCAERCGDRACVNTVYNIEWPMRFDIMYSSSINAYGFSKYSDEYLFAKLDILEHPNALQCLAVKIENNRASCIMPSTQQAEEADTVAAAEKLVEIINDHVLPSMHATSNLDGYYPFGMKSIRMHGFGWAVSVNVDHKGRVLLMPDMRYHVSSGGHKIHPAQHGEINNHNCFVDYIPLEFNFLKDALSNCHSNVYNAISKVIFQFKQNVVPLIDEPAVKPYVHVRNEQGINLISLISDSSNEALDLEMQCVEIMQNVMLPSLTSPELNLAGYYCIDDGMYPMPKTNMDTDICFVSRGEYRKWVDSMLHWPPKLIVSSDDRIYWFSSGMRSGMTHLSPEEFSRKTCADLDHIRWNAVAASEAVTRENAIEYILRCLYKIHTVNRNLLVNVRSV